MKNKIIEKPWGSEELIELNSKYCLKKLFMKKGHRCSLQYHEKKVETIYVLEGILTIEVNKKTINLKPNESITISVGDVHRMSAVNSDAYYLESSTPELEDVIRIEDDFGRN
jgi:mannose-6-phosphate isomerase-like protein (cupin superfamily)